MGERVNELFAEYADAYARGQRPQALEYVARADDKGDELARLIDRFVASAPAPEPNEEELTLTAAWLSGDPPLLELRRRRGLKRHQVVDALVMTLGIDARKREKVGRYYHELESGLLNAERVDPSVWDALAKTLKARVVDLAAWRPLASPPEPAYFRIPDALAGMAQVDTQAPDSVGRPSEDRDEVDRLFGAGPS